MKRLGLMAVLMAACSPTMPMPDAGSGGGAGGGGSMSACGNGKLDTGERCDSAIATGLDGACPSLCNDGAVCTSDALTGGPCQGVCTSVEITACISGDGCCPAGCTPAQDLDCSTTCGNGTVEAPETCDTAIASGQLGACPVSCDDSVSCTADRVTGSGCSTQCAHTPITACGGGDGCCPSGCDAASDSDCSAGCGNGHVDMGESCDTAIASGQAGACPMGCDDSVACTADQRVGSACTTACTHAPIAACTSGDGCCPGGCTHAQDTDCSASCGNGVVEPPETCDTAITPGQTGACPTACNDTDLCTTDTVMGAMCSVMCAHTAITQCLNADGCCPGACTPANDTDCCDLPKVTAPVTVNYDARTASVQGTVTLNGAMMPDDTQLDGQPRGCLWFVDAVGGAVIIVCLGETGAAQYGITLFQSTYDVYLYARTRSAQSVLPDGATVKLASNLAITGNTTRNFDLKTAAVSGTVTLNGSAMPDNTVPGGGARGCLVFRDTVNPSQVQVCLGSSGAAQYGVTVFQSTYDVLIDSLASAVQSVLPDAAEVKLMSGVAISAPTTRNFDVKTAPVSGTVTLNGGAMPDDTQLDGSPRGCLRFTDAATHSPTRVCLGETGAAQYGVTLFQSTYDVAIESGARAAQSVLPDAASVKLASGVAVSAPTTRNFDVKTAAVSGTVTLNGAAMPNDTVADGLPRGCLRFTEAGFSQTVVCLGETGPAQYGVTLFQGTYSISLESGPRAQQSVLPDAAKVRLETGVAITAPTTRNEDAKTAAVTATVTLNGAAMPDDTLSDGQPRGCVTFHEVSTASSTPVCIGEAGAAQLGVTLFQGKYDVALLAGPAGQQSVLPGSAAASLELGLVLTGPMSRSYDAKTASVSGTVTLNGATMPNDTQLDGQSRGFLTFEDRVSGTSSLVNLGETGAAQYGITLFQSSYDVTLHSRGAAQQSVLPDNSWVRVRRGCP